MTQPPEEPAKRRISQDASVVLASVAVQVPLAIFLSHLYDMPIFMATGFLSAHGLNPYVATDLSGVFGSPVFHGITTIGYPPPWPLLAGVLYRLSYSMVPSLLLYNFALKVPVIAANVCLAFLARSLARSTGAGEIGARRAMTFILWNPLILYTSSAWGQLDTIATLLALLSFFLLHHERRDIGAVLLALAVSFKPIALPLVPVCLAFAGGGSARRCIRFTAVFMAALALFCVAPFAFFRWDPGVIIRNWNAHFVVAGGLSWLSFFELFGKGYELPPALRFLGFLWVPGLAAGLLFLKPRGRSLKEMLEWSLRLTLIFFLTRAWLSEPNITLVLCIALVLRSAGCLGERTLRALWLLPLVFTFWNLSLPQLFFLVYPPIMSTLSPFVDTLRIPWLAARSLSVIPWQIVGWGIVGFGRAAVKASGNARTSTDASTSDDARASDDPFASVTASAATETLKEAPGDAPALVSLILPTFNEAGNIAEAIQRAELCLRQLEGCDSEIVIVDDGSSDGTTDVALDAVRRFGNVRILQRGSRKGLASAIRDGISMSRGSIIAVMDADLQHPPESLTELYKAIRQGADLAIMSRYARGGSTTGWSSARRQASRCAILLTRVLLPETMGVKDPLSGFFMVRRSALPGLGLHAYGYKVLPEILFRGASLRVNELPYAFQQRRSGKSKMRAVESFLFLRLLMSLRKKRGHDRIT